MSLEIVHNRVSYFLIISFIHILVCYEVDVRVKKSNKILFNECYDKYQLMINSDKFLQWQIYINFDLVTLFA